MELLKATEENIDKMTRKGLNSKSWIFHPEKFAEYSSICSEDLLIMSIRVLSSLSERLELSDKFITDFVYPLSQYNGEDMGAIRLKNIISTILSNMTREIVRFTRFDGSVFCRTFIIKDDESSQDIIETFIYNYNKTKYKTSDMVNYNYELLQVERIM